jgi:ABC-type polysaccharide/polyol phosphate export permease
MTGLAGNASPDQPLYDSSRRRSAFVEELLTVLQYRDLVHQLIARTIKTRYKRSVLGVAWTMVNPLLTMLVLTLVFSTIFEFEAGSYALFVLSGLLIWNFFAQSTTAAMGDLIWSGGLVGRIYLPKSAFSVAAIGTALVNLGLALLPYALIALVLGAHPHWTWLLLPLPALMIAVLSLGVGLGLSAAAVYFPDVMPTYEVLLMAWMYLTPVIYPIHVLPASIQQLLKLNPVYYPLAVFRALLVDGRLPAAADVTVGMATALAALFIGWWVFTRRSREMAYRV